MKLTAVLIPIKIPPLAAAEPHFCLIIPKTEDFCFSQAFVKINCFSFFPPFLRKWRADKIIVSFLKAEISWRVSRNGFQLKLLWQMVEFDFILRAVVLDILFLCTKAYICSRIFFYIAVAFLSRGSLCYFFYWHYALLKA